MSGLQTVLGSIDSSELGVTLFHEHIFNDASHAWCGRDAKDPHDREIAGEPVRMEFLGRLRNDPYLSLDNTRLDSLETAVEETMCFAEVGGRTIIDQGSNGMGADPQGLRIVAERTGLNIIMGCGYYLQRTLPDSILKMTPDDIADEIERELTEGADGVRAGIIGEIGIGLDFTPAEEHSLRGAVRAQRRTNVPLSVHLPGWLRYGHRVLDIVAEEDGNIDATVLCHMNPSMYDRDYQRSLADRGAWIGYDMIGMELNYPGEGQSPSDEENARAIVSLIEDGYAEQLLLSGDTFIKNLLRSYGGFGYAHILTSFLPRLEAHGVPGKVALDLLTLNPRRVFDTAAKGADS